MKKLKSIFGSLDKCYFTKTTREVERHHCLGSFNRRRSEKYGFIVALKKELHPNGVHVRDDYIKKFTPFNDRWELDEWLKQECQRHYEETHSREEWLQEFGQSWL